MEPVIDSSLCVRAENTISHSWALLELRGSLNTSLAFLQPHFSSPFGPSVWCYNECVGSVVTAVRGPDLGNRTPTGDPESPRQSSLTVLLLGLSHRHNDFASMEPRLSVQVCHSSMLACVKVPATTAPLYTSFLPQHDDFTAARLARAEEAYVDDGNSLDWIRKPFFPQEFVVFGHKRKDQILFYVGSPGDYADIKG